LGECGTARSYVCSKSIIEDLVENGHHHASTHYDHHIGFPEVSRGVNRLRVRMTVQGRSSFAALSNLTGCPFSLYFTFIKQAYIKKHLYTPSTSSG
jgi:hypothetical protein